MTQVAAEAGVSVMTASYAYGKPDRVSPDARAKVLEAARRLGYPGPHPAARSLRIGRTGSLGVIVGEKLTYAFDDPQATRFLSGVAAVCLEHQLGMTLIPITGEPTDVNRVVEAAVDAFVVWTTVDNDPILDAITAMGRPAAVLGGPARPDMALVSIDDRAAAAAIAALAFVGARRPAVLSFPLDRSRQSQIWHGPDPDAPPFSVTRHRLQGFRDAAAGLGIAWSDVKVAVASRNDVGEGSALTDTLLASAEPPDAIAAMSDELAFGVLRSVRSRGLTVPGDVNVTGWDDAAAAGPAGLTTVAQSLRDQGERCARLALGDPVPPESPAWKVIERSSTRRPGRQI
jgi:DNA-binding LacI/PurR family transcriptional regulator